MAHITPTEIDDTLEVLRKYTRWSEIDLDASDLESLIRNSPKEFGRQFTAFLQNGGRTTIEVPGAVYVDRPTLVDPSTFVGNEGWSVIEEKPDARVSLQKIFIPSSIQLHSMHARDEVSISGEERIKRVEEAGHIRLDFGVFLVLWNNQQLIPENWKENPDGTDCCICFDGTILSSPHGERYVFCLYWNDNNWCWTLDWLNRSDRSDSVSAVLFRSDAA